MKQLWLIGPVAVAAAFALGAARPAPPAERRAGGGAAAGGEKDSRCRFPEGPEGCCAETTPGVFFAAEAAPAPPGIALAEPDGGPTEADRAEHLRTLKARLPEGFTVVVPPKGGPFVVIGDETPEMVRVRAARTVQWAVEKLKADYFEKDPPAIIDVWLFKDAASYRQHAKALFGDEPDTPFGYFSHRHQALIMNIATGGGTLVHEIVHPYMHANFPACPTWFDEGLASLYEQSAERGGHIVGLTNWRLAGLQKAIRAGEVPSFKDLAATSDRQFRAMDGGRNYAQARYLCYWLQEHGLLVKFYRAFRAAHQKDPTGYETLKAVLGRDEKGMAAFQKEWEAWVLTLRFP